MVKSKVGQAKSKQAVGSRMKSASKVGQAKSKGQKVWSRISQAKEPFKEY